MPIGLRKRPRLPEERATPVRPGSTITSAPLNPTPVDGNRRPAITAFIRSLRAPAIDQPAQPAPPPQAAKHSPVPAVRRQRSRARDGWADRLLAQGFLLLLSCLVWQLNAAFTILYITSLTGITPLWAWLAAAVHLGISKVEVALWDRLRDPRYLLPWLGCAILDIGSTLAGAMTIISTRVPQLLGDAPQRILEWRAIVAELLQGRPAPAWWFNAVALVVLAGLFALGSEHLLRKYRDDLVEVWRERRPASE